jgi:hypothetical protein
MTVPWVGARRIAIVPVWNEQVDSEPDQHFREQVEARVFYDPQGPDGDDDSLQNYVWTVSYGKATISGTLFPTVRSEDTDVTGAAMDSLPAGHGYTRLLAVLPHGYGPHRRAYAWWDISPRNGITAFARVALFQDPTQTMRQPTGVWAMETLHMTTEFGDLYNVSPNLGAYDVMANAGASSHPTAHTKSAMGWIDATGIVQHGSGTRTYVLHAIGLRQPPPPDRVTAVRIPASDGRSFVVEARLHVDDYERPDTSGDGIPAEGVIVYEVAGLLDVRLRTATALAPGQSYSNADAGLTVSVTGTVPGGRRISVARAEDPRCEGIRDTIEQLLELLEDETDIEERKRLLSALGMARRQAQALGCRAR